MKKTYVFFYICLGLINTNVPSFERIENIIITSISFGKIAGK